MELILAHHNHDNQEGRVDTPQNANKAEKTGGFQGRETPASYQPRSHGQKENTLGGKGDKHLILALKEPRMLNILGQSHSKRRKCNMTSASIRQMLLIRR